MAIATASPCGMCSTPPSACAMACVITTPAEPNAAPANVAGLALPSNVEVLLDQSPARLRDLYRGAACVAIPTHGDDWPHGSDCSGTLVMLDAMASGRAAVVSDRAALSDYIVPGREALTVPPGDPSRLAAALGKLLGQPARALQMGQAGRASIEAGLTTRHFAERLVPLLAGERPTGGST